MNAQDFVYWLQGFSEMTDKKPTEKQWKIIQNHLSLVFNKVTPNRIAPILPHNPLPINPYPSVPHPLSPDFPEKFPQITCNDNTSNDFLFCKKAQNMMHTTDETDFLKKDK